MKQFPQVLWSVFICRKDSKRNQMLYVLMTMCSTGNAIFFEIYEIYDECGTKYQIQA